MVPPPNDQSSEFEYDGKLMTVVEFFEYRNEKEPVRYPSICYRRFPTVMVGCHYGYTMLVPMEFVHVFEAQQIRDPIPFEVKEAMSGISDSF